MFIPIIAVILFALGFASYIVDGATTVQLASFFTIVLSSFLLLMKQQKKEFFNIAKFPSTKQ
ncbi:hypothetical protein [Mesobacillus zeae]|uniref:Uncharacterized protein n=1 Tax=Mesobacillus zeae TaxID=1917180 RepID=A0A398AY12_9BACI|nr:hypothetical protein [Mesobacillus zeae]RID81618.1 hypothetical protein D1970_21315 [Mesobacillus zeae]